MSCLDRRALYVEEWNSWATYSEETGRWSKAGTREIAKRAKDWLKDKHKNLSDRFTPQQLTSLLNKKKIDAITALASNDTLTHADEFDQRKDLFSVGNGVVNLRTGELREARPEDRFTKGTDIPLLTGADTDGKSLKALLRVLPSDAIEYVQVLIGQSLTGYQPTESVIHFLHGQGGNGKSSLLALMTRIGGTTSVRPSTDVLTSQGSGFGIMTLEGARAAIFEELPQARYLDAKTLKLLTGTPIITGEQKYEAARSFEMVATSFVSTNFLPQATEGGHSTWRRLLAIPFDKTFKVGATDENENVLPADPELEAGSIVGMDADNKLLTAGLRWAVKGAVVWFRNNRKLLGTPGSIVEATNSWKLATDALEAFVSDTLVADEESFVLVQDAYDAYRLFMTAQGANPLKKTSWEQSLIGQCQLDIPNGKVRHTDMRHSSWSDPTKNWRENYEPRSEGTQNHIIRGVCFNTTHD